MIRNQAGQKWTVIPIDSTTGLAVSGIAATITAKIRKDGGALVDTHDLHPEEIEDSQYDFEITQGECNAYKLNFYPESSTPGVVVFALPPVIYTTDG